MILDNEANSLTGEEFIGFILVFSQLLRPIQGISTSVANINKAKASLERINEVLEADERVGEEVHGDDSGERGEVGGGKEGEQGDGVEN